MLSDKILVVDDDDRVIESVKLAFPEYEVIGFRQGDKATQYMGKPNDISLILLDVFINGDSGLEILTEIRKINEEIPIIIMTAFGSMDIVVEALRGRASEFIEKPFNVDELREKVRVLLKKKSLYFKDANSQDEKVKRIKRFVDRNYLNVSLESIADEVCLSSKYVSRMFKQKNKTSYRDYKVNVKLEKAKTLLRDSAMTISEISNKLGYQNPESFMRLFKRKEKITPSQYRAQFTK